MSIQVEKKFLADPSGRGLNADDSFFAIEPYQIVNGENVRTGTTDAGYTATVESIGSNVRLSEFQPSVTYVTIGTSEDSQNRFVINFKCCTTGPWHRIEACYKPTGTIYNVLLSSQVTGGLNFEKNSLIHSARVEAGLLYWCEGTSNEPRRINIRAGINLNHPGAFPDVTAYTDPLVQSDIAWIRRQPGLPLEVEKDEEVLFENNFIKNEAFLFQYRYISREYETSTLSPFSVLMNYNGVDDDFNNILISVPFLETITQDVLQVDLVAKYINGNTSFVIKSWNKNVAADLAEIQAHNAGITQLTYQFFNDFTGIALDQAYSVKPFDSLPIYAQTIEMARNRAFMANVVIGYDTPVAAPTSLSGSVTIQQDGTDVIGRWIIIDYGAGAHHTFIDIQNMTSGNGFYDVIPDPPGPPFADPIDFAFLHFVASGPASFAFYVVMHYPMWTNGIAYTGQESVVSSPPFPPAGLAGQRCFKTQASYKLTTTFYDFAGRKCGITSSGTTINVADRLYAQINFTTAINWTLSNNNAVNEIPDWASYYSIDLTKCLRTRFFEQMRGKTPAYATKDADGVYVFTTTAYAATLNGCAFDITSLESAGMGYVFTDGDIIKIYNGTDIFTLAIVAQDGNWLVTELQDLGTLDASFLYLFEIYTPYKPSISEPFYEVGQIFQVTDPGTTGRQYSVIGGSINGDVTLVTRNDGSDDYIVEAMSPNDKFYKVWNTDSGRPNFADTLGQVVKKDSIAYSNTIIEGTKSNGLCTFDALDVKEVPLECGPITKLQSTSKVNNEIGVVMLCICSEETASLYIGESQLVGSTGNAFIASAPEVIGTINILKGSFGCIDPSSVVEYRGMCFWLDRINGRVIQYSVNGLFPVSDYKMRRYWNLFCKQFNAMTEEEIEALGSRPFVFGGIDPYHNEVLFAVPKLLETPPKGFLPDYPSTVYPFDIWDGQAKTLVYKLMETGNSFWFAPYSWKPDYFASLENSLYSYKDGQTYLHNSTTSFNNFYGVQYTSKVMCVFNQIPDKPKVYNAIGVQANVPPIFTYFYNKYPEQQSSDLEDFSYKDLEGIFYATILRNKLIPTAYGFSTDGLLTGEKMRNVAMQTLVEFASSDEQLELKFISLSFSVSRGHLKV